MTSSSEAGGESPSTATRTSGFGSVLVGALPPAVGVAVVVGWATVVGDGGGALPVVVALAVLVIGGVAYGWRLGDGGWNAFGLGFVGAVLGLPLGIVAAGLLPGGGFAVADFAASLLLLTLFGSLGVLLLVPYPVAAGLAAAVRGRV